jgi:hypothetical protein
MEGNVKNGSIRSSNIVVLTFGVRVPDRRVVSDEKARLTSCVGIGAAARDRFGAS